MTRLHKAFTKVKYSCSLNSRDRFTPNSLNGNGLGWFHGLVSRKVTAKISWRLKLMWHCIHFWNCDQAVWTRLIGVIFHLLLLSCRNVHIKRFSGHETLLCNVGRVLMIITRSQCMKYYSSLYSHHTYTRYRILLVLLVNSHTYNCWGLFRFSTIECPSVHNLEITLNNTSPMLHSHSHSNVSFDHTLKRKIDLFQTGSQYIPRQECRGSHDLAPPMLSPIGWGFAEFDTFHSKSIIRVKLRCANRRKETI